MNTGIALIAETRRKLPAASYRKSLYTAEGNLISAVNGIEQFFADGIAPANLISQLAESAALIAQGIDELQKQGLK